MSGQQWRPLFQRPFLLYHCGGDFYAWVYLRGRGFGVGVGGPQGLQRKVFKTDGWGPQYRPFLVRGFTSSCFGVWGYKAIKTFPYLLLVVDILSITSALSLRSFPSGPDLRYWLCVYGVILSALVFCCFTTGPSFRACGVTGAPRGVVWFQRNLRRRPASQRSNSFHQRCMVRVFQGIQKVLLRWPL